MAVSFNRFYSRINEYDFSLSARYGSLAATQPSFKRTLKNVGLPDKIDIRLSSRL
jgi:hypothetical protein